MRIVISGIPIDIQKKNIKNMHLQIKPPDGHVVISAPLSMDTFRGASKTYTVCFISHG